MYGYDAILRVVTILAHIANSTFAAYKGQWFMHAWSQYYGRKIELKSRLLL